MWWRNTELQHRALPCYGLSLHVSNESYVRRIATDMLLSEQSDLVRRVMYLRRTNRNLGFRLF